MNENATATFKTFILWPADQDSNYYNLGLLDEQASGNAADRSMEIYYRIRAQPTLAWLPTLRELFLHHGGLQSDAVATARGMSKSTRDLYGRRPPHYVFKVSRGTGSDRVKMESFYAGRDFTFAHAIDGEERHFSWKQTSIFGSSYKLVDVKEPQTRIAMFTFKKGEKECGDLTVDADRGLDFEYLVIITWMCVLEVMKDRQVKLTKLKKLPIEVPLWILRLFFYSGGGDGGGGGGGD